MFLSHGLFSIISKLFPNLLIYYLRVGFMPPFHHFDTKQPDYIRFIVNHAFIIGNSDGKMMQRNMISMFMCKLFDEMPIRRVVSLNSLLSSYMSTRQLKEEILLSTNDAIYDSFFFPSNKLTRLFKAEGRWMTLQLLKFSRLSRILRVSVIGRVQTKPPIHRPK